MQRWWRGLADPRAPGRMIRKDASNSKRLARLSPRALSLFLMLVPHYSSFGKMNGDPMFLKSEVVPHIPWFTLPVIRKALKEIDQETNVKWFQSGGRWYLHSLSWDEHQDLRTDRLGIDRLPSHPSAKVPEKSRTGPGEVRPEVEGEMQAEKEVETAGARIAPSGGASAPASHQTEPSNGNGKSTPMPPKEVGLNQCLSHFQSGEWDLVKVSEKLRLFGYSSAEINSPEILRLFVTEEVTP